MLRMRLKMMKFKLYLIGIAVLLIICLLVGFVGYFVGSSSAPVYKAPTVDLSTVTEGGELGVLSAHVNILNSLVIGSSRNPKYMSLYGQEGTAVYTVDLSQVDIFWGKNMQGETLAVVTLPEPEVRLYIDESTTEDIAEFQANSWTGAAEDGYMAYHEQTEAGYEKMLESLQDSEGLMLTAKDSAITQVKMLLDAINVDDVKFEVYFPSEGR